MKEAASTDYQSFSSMPHKLETDKWHRFAVQVAGKTFEAQVQWVHKLRDIDQAEVNEDEQHDYLLMFCPVASRVQTDISEALSKLNSDKPVLLVVMHHTPDPNYVLAESRRVVENPNVFLTVDCLFHEGRLLDCKHNNEAWSQIQTSLHRSEDSCYQKCKNFFRRLPFWQKVFMAGMILGLTGIVTIIVIVLRGMEP
ncbi:hypothetical protein EXN66_Car018821 [Channa argus]|uniref:Uncharacterized protein n=1 Tax=Channa argus TaxID=215402 RepID=A0A6G1QLE5_CHAAH|nr:hypothetical protein EXN66_Car018821 [Channa argus]KAK2889888.1 hypothetical protein Q8A73_018188 [Channa argus]